MTTVFLIVLVVLLGLSVFLNIHLWTLCKELKAEVESNGEYIGSFRDTNQAN